MFGPGHPQYRPQQPPYYPPQQQQPYYPPPPPPPQRPKPGVSPIVIVLAVLGGLFALGVGALVVIGGVLYVVASAEPESAEPESAVVEPALTGAPTAGGASPVLPVPPASTSTRLRPDQEADEAAGADPASGGDGVPEVPSPAGDDGAGDAPAPAVAGARTPAAPSAGAAKEGSNSGSAAGGTSWWCTASASVRVCGFAGACNYQMVFGNGMGNDRFMASQQAKRSCEASARAKGASAICVVQCSPR
ncbi:hypothetical protein [Sorangium sp. So ce394]|uniref:hypothetical protein n=1 Tax=Sorangium sp. So ce394 TaxID=3133310 RepID=UPI003F5B89E0